MAFKIIIPIWIVLTALSVNGDEWPQFRGPTGQGHSSESHLPLEWNEERNVIWKIPVPGEGWSSPVVSGGRIWLTAALLDKDGASLRAIAFAFKSGREIVNTEIFRLDDAQLLNLKNSHASPTPIVNGDHVYVHFGSTGTAALTTDGKIIWTIRFPYISQHGNGGSPVLYENLLIVNCDGFDKAFVVAVDKNTGKVRWKTARPKPFSQAYSTPLLIRAGKQDQLISVGAFRTIAYEPMSGDEIWRVAYPDGFSNVPSPVYGQGLAYILTGFQQPSLIAVRVDGKGDVTQTHIKWKHQRSVSLTPSPLLVGNELYLVSDIGIVSCLNATTGESHWQQRVMGNYSASPVYADGRIYILSESGVTTVIAAGKEFRVLAENIIDGWTLASMAVSEGSILIRSQYHLYRISR